MNLKSNTAAQRRSHTHAFTNVELVGVLVIFVVLGILFMAALSRPYSKADRIRCSSNLKQVALSFKMYQGNNEGRMPWESKLASDSPPPKQVWQYYLAISNELSIPKILMCPGDVMRLKNVATNFSNGPEGLANLSRKDLAVSYFLGATTSSNQPNASLTGERNLAPNENSALYSSRVAKLVDVLPQSTWSPLTNQSIHDNGGNYALADGSVQQASNTRLQEALKLARDSYGTNATRLLFPQ
jgi:prepilin-type processing-associated H-X9-DG protein